MNTPGQPSPSLAPRPPNDRLAITSLICGILITCFGPIPGSIAIVCGHIARNRIRKSDGALGGAGMALTGLILGYAWFALSALLIVIYGPESIPAVRMMHSSRVRDMNKVRQIAGATEGYSTFYGHLPLSASQSKDFSPEDGAFFDVLRAVDELENPRGSIFFEANAAQLRGAVVVDPWGQPYRIMLDADGDGRVTVGKQTVKARAAVWSVGKNGLDEAGAGDDVNSWQ